MTDCWLGDTEHWRVSVTPTSSQPVSQSMFYLFPLTGVAPWCSLVLPGVFYNVITVSSLPPLPWVLSSLTSLHLYCLAKVSQAYHERTALF